MKKAILLAGAGGGIGRCLLDRFIRDDRVAHIYATGRGAACSTHNKVSWMELDYQRTESIGALADTLRSQVPALDGFVCATGSLHGDHGQPEKTVAHLELASMEALYRINAAGPLALFAQCAPLLKASKRPIALFLSAQVGSIEDNDLGGWFSYRMAKAALNMGVKTAAIEAARWRNEATVVAVHPGTTLSNLSKPFVRNRKKTVCTPEETAQRIDELMHQLGPGNNGTFLTSGGATLPW